jgi:hypothetical protein
MAGHLAVSDLAMETAYFSLTIAAFIFALPKLYS